MSLDICFRSSACAHCGRGSDYERFNITHNLGPMAEACGIYNVLWRGDEHGITKASQLIAPLESALEKLVSEPVRFRMLNSSNGWGTYDDFVPWLATVLGHCKRNPDTTVEFNR